MTRPVHAANPLMGSEILLGQFLTQRTFTAHSSLVLAIKCKKLSKDTCGARAFLSCPRSRRLKPAVRYIPVCTSLRFRSVRVAEIIVSAPLLTAERGSRGARSFSKRLRRSSKWLTLSDLVRQNVFTTCEGGFGSVRPLTSMRRTYS